MIIIFIKILYNSYHIAAAAPVLDNMPDIAVTYCPGPGMIKTQRTVTVKL